MASKRRTEEIATNEAPELVPQPINDNILTLPTVNTKTKKQTIRTIEDLHNASIRSMSDSEKAKYIEALREALVDANTRIELLDHNCQSAYEKVRTVTQQYEELKIKAQTKLQFAKQAISTCNASIILAGTLE